MILSNRTALKEQLDIEIKKLKNQYRSENSWDQLITNKTYHHYPYLDNICHYDYLILDEFHFFIADSVFNKETDQILEKILFDFQFKTKIFLTATPEESIYMLSSYLPYKALEFGFDGPRGFTTAIYNKRQLPGGQRTTFSALIDLNFHAFNIQKFGEPDREIYNNNRKNFQCFINNESEEKFSLLNPLEEHQIIESESKLNTGLRRMSHQGVVNYFPSKDILIYEFERNYDYLDFVYFEKDEELLEEINNEEGKWIIFVSNKRDGEKLREGLNFLITNEEDQNEGESKKKENNLSAAIFIDSTSKNADEESEEYKTYKKIVETSKFDQRFLITTAVLDSGVNIHDSEVTNIVIKSFDKTTFIQMLGRIRNSDNKQITLYLQALGKSDINKKSRRVERYLQAVKEFATSSVAPNIPHGIFEVKQDKTLELIKKEFGETSEFYVESIPTVFCNDRGESFKVGRITWNHLAYAKQYILLQFYGHIIDCMEKKKYNPFSYKNYPLKDFVFVEPTSIGTEKYYIFKGAEEGFEGIGFDYCSYLSDLKPLTMEVVECGNELTEQDITIIEQLSWIEKASSFSQGNYLSFKRKKTQDEMKPELMEWFDRIDGFYIVKSQKVIKQRPFSDVFRINEEVAITREYFFEKLKIAFGEFGFSQIEKINEFVMENEIKYELESITKPFSSWVGEGVLVNLIDDYIEKRESKKESTASFWLIKKK